jgi:predicted Zn-dependent protease
LGQDEEQAARYLRQASTLRQQINDNYSGGADLGNFGIALLNRSRPSESLYYLGSPRNIFAEMDMLPLVEQTQGALDYALRQIYDALQADYDEQGVSTFLAAANRLRTENLPDLANALYLVILSAQVQHEQWQAASHSAEELLAHDAANGAAWAMLGDARSGLGEPTGTAEAYARAVDLDPDNAMLRRNYADALIKTASWAEAAGQLAAAETIEPDAPYLALRWAELAKAQGDRRKAQEWAAEALRHQPGWEEAQALLDWAQQA